MTTHELFVGHDDSTLSSSLDQDLGMSRPVALTAFKETQGTINRVDLEAGVLPALETDVPRGDLSTLATSQAEQQGGDTDKESITNKDNPNASKESNGILKRNIKRAVAVLMLATAGVGIGSSVTNADGCRVLPDGTSVCPPHTDPTYAPRPTVPPTPSPTPKPTPTTTKPKPTPTTQPVPQETFPPATDAIVPAPTEATVAETTIAETVPPESTTTTTTELITIPASTTTTTVVETTVSAVTTTEAISSTLISASTLPQGSSTTTGPAVTEQTNASETTQPQIAVATDTHESGGSGDGGLVLEALGIFGLAAAGIVIEQKKRQRSFSHKLVNAFKTYKSRRFGDTASAAGH